MVKRYYGLNNIPQEKLVNNPLQNYVNETMDFIMALDLLEKAKNDLEYALKYADYAWHRGCVREKRNMISLAGIAGENAERAAGRIAAAIYMIKGDHNAFSDLEHLENKEDHSEGNQ